MANICARKGFINCFFGLVSKAASILIALFFAKIFIELTDGLFGLEELLREKMEVAFAKINGFNEDISQTGIDVAIKEQNISGVLAGLVMKLVGTQTSFPAGTTIAMLVSEKMAGIAVLLSSGVILFFVARIGLRFLKGVLTAIASRITLMNGINMLLGAAVGFLEASLIVCVVLAYFAMFPNATVTEYLGNTLFVGELYANNPLLQIMSSML